MWPSVSFRRWVISPLSIYSSVNSPIIWKIIPRRQSWRTLCKCRDILYCMTPPSSTQWSASSGNHWNYTKHLIIKLPKTKIQTQTSGIKIQWYKICDICWNLKHTHSIQLYTLSAIRKINIHEINKCLTVVILCLFNPLFSWVRCAEHGGGW